MSNQTSNNRATRPGLPTSHVGMVVTRPAALGGGLILGETRGFAGTWQMPQGGIDWVDVESGQMLAAHLATLENSDGPLMRTFQRLPEGDAFAYFGVDPERLRHPVECTLRELMCIQLACALRETKEEIGGAANDLQLVRYYPGRLQYQLPPREGQPVRWGPWMGWFHLEYTGNLDALGPFNNPDDEFTDLVVANMEAACERLTVGGESTETGHSIIGEVAEFRRSLYELLYGFFHFGDPVAKVNDPQSLRIKLIQELVDQ